MAHDPYWTHRWVGRRRLPERYGQRCRVLSAVRGKFLLQFQPDRHMAVTVRGTFRRIHHGGTEDTEMARKLRLIKESRKKVCN